MSVLTGGGGGGNGGHHVSHGHPVRAVLKGQEEEAEAAAAAEAAEREAMMRRVVDGDFAGEEDFVDGKIADLRVLTLNCWGLKVVSKKRRERMRAIGQYLAQSDYEIVTLQEVWCTEDFQLIRSLVSEVLPFAHYFEHGIIGSGTCVFTRAQIRDAVFHEFSANGYPHKLWHGDWYGGKGLGVCQIFYKGFDIHIYTSHYHAEYNRKNDGYLGHRVIHALESAQWIKLASSSADITIYAGDFNTEPQDVPYKLARLIVPLRDAWLESVGGVEDADAGRTCDTPHNSFGAAKNDGDKGKRIDYVMFTPGPNIKADVVSCELPLPSRVPGLTFSYSDHEAVAATLRLRRVSSHMNTFRSVGDFARMASVGCREDCVAAVDEALAIVRRSHSNVASDGLRYSVLAFLILLLLVVSFLPVALIETDYHAVLSAALFIPQFLLTLIAAYFFLMATVFNRKEGNTLKAAKLSLELIRDQDLLGVRAEGNLKTGPRRKMS